MARTTASRRSRMKAAAPYLVATLLLVYFLSVAIIPAMGQGEGRIVTSGGTFTSLSEALSTTAPGETVDIYGGVYSEAVEINSPVTLIGHDWPVIDGAGRGTVVEINAPDVTIHGLVIRNSGASLDQENSGIAVEAPRALVEGNRIEDTLFGIYLRRANDSIIRDNNITSKDLDVPRRGDPIRIWYSNGVRVEGNEVVRGRDVVLWYSQDLTVRNNTVQHGRYGLHFMYCDDATIENNLLAYNSVGTFLMYSRRLHLINNTIAHNRGPSGYGVGLKDMDDAVIRNNLFLDNRAGAHLDTSPREVDSIGIFEGNIFAYNDIGVSLMPSVRNNHFSGNSFVDNEEQVGIAGGGGRLLSENLWTIDGKGNYWSDYVGYDGDGDGLGDVPYKSERLFENLVDNNSSLRLFLYSPVEQAVDFAARAIPFVRPQPKLTDEAPLMQPIVPPDLPGMERPDGKPVLVVSAGMLLLALLIIVFGIAGPTLVSKAGREDHLPGAVRPFWS